MARAIFPHQCVIALWAKVFAKVFLVHAILIMLKAADYAVDKFVHQVDRATGVMQNETAVNIR